MPVCRARSARRGAAPSDSDRATDLMLSASDHLMRTQSACTAQRIIRHNLPFVPLLKLNAHPGGSTAGWAFVIPYGKFSYLCTVGSMRGLTHYSEGSPLSVGAVRSHLPQTYFSRKDVVQVENTRYGFNSCCCYISFGVVGLSLQAGKVYKGGAAHGGKRSSRHAYNKSPVGLYGRQDPV